MVRWLWCLSLLVGDFGLCISVGIVDHSVEGLIDPLTSDHLQGSSVCVRVHMCVYMCVQQYHVHVLYVVMHVILMVVHIPYHTHRVHDDTQPMRMREYIMR
jgi:hypothetical protein